MIDSPCHHCAKCPCKEHDTCGDYREYRATLDNIRRENMKNSVIKDYIHVSITKRKRRERNK